MSSEFGLNSPRVPVCSRFIKRGTKSWPGGAISQTSHGKPHMAGVVARLPRPTGTHRGQHVAVAQLPPPRG